MSRSQKFLTATAAALVALMGLVGFSLKDYVPFFEPTAKRTHLRVDPYPEGDRLTHQAGDLWARLLLEPVEGVKITRAWLASGAQLRVRARDARHFDVDSGNPKEPAFLWRSGDALVVAGDLEGPKVAEWTLFLKDATDSSRLELGRKWWVGIGVVLLLLVVGFAAWKALKEEKVVPLSGVTIVFGLIESLQGADAVETAEMRRMLTTAIFGAGPTAALRASKRPVSERVVLFRAAFNALKEQGERVQLEITNILDRPALNRL